MSAETHITYVYAGHVERCSRRGYYWTNGYSEGGTVQPWLTRREAQADARKRGKIARFVMGVSRG